MSIRVLKFYPAGAVQVNSPVPFSERVDDRCRGIWLPIKACHFPHQPSLRISSTIGSGTSPQSRTSQGKC